MACCDDSKNKHAPKRFGSSRHSRIQSFEPGEDWRWCYVEFGHDQVGRVDVNFLSGPRPTGTFQDPSEALVAEKLHFGSSRVRRWFGREWSAKG